MLIMQYDITLPADYDMRIIRDRVARGGPSFDSFPGLGLKCFLIAEKGVRGAAANAYAPVYLWPHAEQMWGFLAGPAFATLKADFGAPPVAIWPGFAWARSPDLGPARIASVTRTAVALPSDTDLVALRARERADAADAVAGDGALLARAVGLDPRSWGLVRFDYRAHPPGERAAGAHGFEVLHSSAPALMELAR